HIGVRIRACSRSIPRRDRTVAEESARADARRQNPLLRRDDPSGRFRRTRAADRKTRAARRLSADEGAQSIPARRLSATVTSWRPRVSRTVQLELWLDAPRARLSAPARSCVWPWALRS